MGGVAGGGAGISLGGPGVVGRDSRMDGGRSVHSSSLSAAAAVAAAGVGCGMDAQGTLWPAFAMHQPGDSVTFLPRRGDDSYAMSRGHSTAGVPRGAGGSYGNLQAMGGGLTASGVSGPGGAGGLGVFGGGAFAGQALPLGYPAPLLLEHVSSTLELAAGVLREAGAASASEEEDVGVGVVGRCVRVLESCIVFMCIL